MSATLQDIARKYDKSADEVRRALPLVGHGARNLSLVAAIPDEIEQKLEAFWLEQDARAAAPKTAPAPAKPDQKRVVGGAEIAVRKRRQFERPARARPPRPSRAEREQRAAAAAQAKARADAAAKAEAEAQAKAKAAAKAAAEPVTPNTRPPAPAPTPAPAPAPTAPPVAATPAPVAPTPAPAPAATSPAPASSPAPAPATKKKTEPARAAAPARKAPVPQPAAEPAAPARVVAEKPDAQKTAAELLYERQIAATRQAAAPAAPAPADPPAAAPTEEAAAPSTPAAPAPKKTTKPPRAAIADEDDDEDDADAGMSPAQTSRPRPAPMAGDDDDDGFRARRARRGIITIDEKVVRRRKRKRERQAPRARADAGENLHRFQLPDRPIARTVRIGQTISLQNLADQLAMKAAALNAKLRAIGAVPADPLDRDTAWLLAEELGHKPVAAREKDLESELLSAPDPAAAANLRPRPPVVTVMGHVDHGKTSLLDALRKTRVAQGEAGGITQHIGACQIQAPDGRPVTFIDTPGHELFTQMRARGAKVTDLVALVVAADDGVKPQTAEAIAHAKAAAVPLVVAANKMDKPDADLDRVKRELGEHEVLPEDWGGDAIVVPVSAETGQGLNDLLAAILLQGEVLDLKAPADGPGAGVVLEGRIDKGRGPVASVMVRRGTLRKGDAVLCGAESGKIRAMWDANGKAVAAAGPSTPVEIQGLSGLPETGAELRALADGKKAREVAELRGEKQRAARLAENLKPPVDILAALAALESTKKELRLVVKADVAGSREALVQALEKISGEAGEARILHSGVGAVSESDAHLADSAGAWIVAFNVRPDARARKLMERRKLRMIAGRVIYDIVESAREALLGMLEPVVEERILGTAEVQKVFPIAKVGNVAGCKITEGFARAGAAARLLRDGAVVYRGEIASLRRFKEGAQEVRAGEECGIFLRRYNDAKPGDTIEIFETVETAPQI